MNPPSFATPRPCWESIWHPIIAVGGGYFFTSDVGKNQTFPILNPITDEFFIYHANNGSQTLGFGEAFAGVEWWLNNKAAVQFGLAYDQTFSSIKIKGTLTQGADVPSQDVFSYRYKVILRQLMAESKLLGTFAQFYHPYLMAGAGAAFNSASDFNVNMPPFITFTREYQSNTQTSFSFVLGFGLDYDLDQVFRIGIGYRYANLGNVEFGSATIDNVPVPGTFENKNIHTNEVIAQITANFS